MNRERTTQEELKDRLVSPGILGLAAAAGAFAMAYNVWWIHAYVDPRPELDPLATPFAFFLIVLGLVIAFYYGLTIANILGFAGIVLSVIAGVKIWTSKVSKLHAPKQ